MYKSGTVPYDECLLTKDAARLLGMKERTFLRLARTNNVKGVMPMYQKKRWSIDQVKQVNKSAKVRDFNLLMPFFAIMAFEAAQGSDLS